jgi:hypothetical protein
MAARWRRGVWWRWRPAARRGRRRVDFKIDRRSVVGDGHHSPRRSAVAIAARSACVVRRGGSSLRSWAATIRRASCPTSSGIVGSRLPRLRSITRAFGFAGTLTRESSMSSHFVNRIPPSRSGSRAIGTDRDGFDHASLRQRAILVGELANALGSEFAERLEAAPFLTSIYGHMPIGWLGSC